MSRVTKKPPTEVPAVRTPDVLEVIHHEVPDTAAGAGAAPIESAAAVPDTVPAKPKTFRAGGMTWRRMLRAVAITEAAGLAVLLVAGMVYGMSFFPPIAVAAALFAGAAVWLPRMSKAGVVYTLVITSLVFLAFGVGFFGWTGFMYPQSWFEMAFATLTVLVPVMGIVAAIATLRHKDGENAARKTALVTGVLAGAIVLTGIAGAAMSSDPTKLPGDTTLTAMDFEFSQDALTAKAGDVTIYFENDDVFAHNVAIKDHGTSDIANGRSAIRHTFKNMTAGTYEYICYIHPDMKGVLTVT